MDRFEYRAIDASGQMQTGTLEAESLSDVLQQLERAGFTPLDTRKSRAGRAGRSWREQLTPEPRAEHITAFTLDLAMLLRGGVVLGEGLQVLAGIEQRAWFRRVIRDLHGAIASGKSFSAALANHPRLFPPVYAKTVEVAEATGRLESALAGLARERQRSEAIRRRVTSAIAYPLFLVVAAVGVLCFVLLYIIPQFEVAIASYRDRMDPSSLLVFDLSRAFRDNTDTVLTALALVLAVVVVLQRYARERGWWVSLFSRLPLTRTILAYDETVTFCRTLALLAENGVDISSALRLIKGVLRRPTSRDRLERVTGDVRQGRRLSDALSRADLLPNHVVQMLRIGEESGELAESATRVSQFYEAKLDSTLGKLTAIIGPLLMIGVSILIAWVIISVMSALISINDLLV